MRNLRLVLAYDGTDFHGWQRQPGLPTIQETLEACVQGVTGQRVDVWGSGRTDAGVHALGQVANFKTDCPIPCENLRKALNNVLPATVRVKDVHEVSDKFHARYDVRAKTYRYRILQTPICSPFLWRFVCHYPFPLDRRRMAEAARLIEGEHDFTSFAASEGAGENFRGDAGTSHGPPEKREQHEGAPLPNRRGSGEMVRKISSSRILWRPRTSMLIYEISGNGFLHHMVRNIVGTLVEVGRGRLAPGDITRILVARDRSFAGPTAPAQGLYLVKVEY
jgi:tRNA pseudouridine38-40 synthase